MEYNDTVNGMLSPDYNERFKAEYQQTKIRYEKLKNLNNKIEGRYHTGEDYLNFEPETPAELLKDQQRIMGEYLHILEVRAIIEEIDLK